MKKLQALVLVLTAVVLVAADDDAVKKEKAKLKGAWEVVSMEENGKKAPFPEGAKLRLRFQDDKVAVEISLGGVDDKKDAAYKIDPAKQPAWLDIVPEDGDEKGKTFQCIYVLDKDDLKICAAKAGVERPKEFATKEGSKTSLMILKRDKQ